MSISTVEINTLLDAFAKMRKATIIFISVRPSVRLSVCMLRSRDFHETEHLSIFRKSVEKIQDTLKSHNNYKYFT